MILEIAWHYYDVMSFLISRARVTDRWKILIYFTDRFFHIAQLAAIVSNDSRVRSNDGGEYCHAQGRACTVCRACRAYMDCRAGYRRCCLLL